MCFISLLDCQKTELSRLDYCVLVSLLVCVLNVYTRN